MFEKVTYMQYSDVLGRSAVPDEKTFNALALEQKAYVRTLLPFLAGRGEDGIDNAVCMMTEEQYRNDKAGEDGRKVTSESVSGFSQSFDVTGVRTLFDKKMYWLNLYCFVNTAVL